MHDASCIGINYAYAHSFFKCFRSLHTLLGFALCFMSSILILVAVTIYSMLTSTRIPCRDSHCENGSFEVLSLHQSQNVKGTLTQLKTQHLITLCEQTSQSVVGLTVTFARDVGDVPRQVVHNLRIITERDWASLPPAHAIAVPSVRVMQSFWCGISRRPPDNERRMLNQFNTSSQATCREKHQRIENSQPQNSFERRHAPPFDLLNHTQNKEAQTKCRKASSRQRHKYVQNCPQPEARLCMEREN